MYKNYEVWIIDGGSEDGTLFFLETLQAPFYSVSETDQGIYDAMNTGIEKSKGEWLYFMGTDDCFYSTNVLQDVLPFFNDTGIDLIFGSIEYKVEKHLPFIYNKNKIEKQPQWNWKIWIYNPVHHQGTFHRRSVFKSTRYNITYRFLSDYAMNIHFYRKQLKSKLVSVKIAVCSSAGISKTGNWELYKEEIKLKRKASTVFFTPFFYVLALSKFFIRKTQNGTK